MAVQNGNFAIRLPVLEGVRDWFQNHPLAAKVVKAAALVFSLISLFSIPFAFHLGGLAVVLLLTPPIIAILAHRLLFPDRVVEIAQPPLQPVAPDPLALRAIWIRRIGENPLDLEQAPIALRDDKEIVLIAVRIKAQALKFASEALKNDPEVVRAAIGQNAWWGLFYASEEIKNNIEIVREAIHQDGTALECASKELQAHEAIVREAVQQNGKALNCVHYAYKRDRAIVLLAVRNKGEALRSASEDLRDDKEVVMVAVNEWGGSLPDASPRLLRDEEVLLAAVTNCHFTFKNFPADFKINRPFILRVLQQNGLVLEHLSEDFRRDPEIIEVAVRQNILARRYAL